MSTLPLIVQPSSLYLSQFSPTLLIQRSSQLYGRGRLLGQLVNPESLSPPSPTPLCFDSLSSTHFLLAACRVVLFGVVYFVIHIY
jgi:hypothetical protein